MRTLGTLAHTTVVETAPPTAVTAGSDPIALALRASQERSEPRDHARVAGKGQVAASGRYRERGSAGSSRRASLCGLRIA
jgi:hypothetical protein